MELEVVEVEFYQGPHEILLTKPEAAYASKVEVFGTKVKKYDNFTSDAKLEFKLKNNGNKAIVKIYMKAYFHDVAGNILQATPFSKALIDGLPPGEVWQFPRGEGYAVMGLPKQWDPANVTFEVMGAEFKE